ncbi:MAG: ACT domain-containing protein [Clostridia bacterium]|nr:ACT domain-containing protein [Clostridia bacterium]
MEKKYSYLLVNTEVAPEVFVKVVEAKKLFASGKCKTIGEAIECAKISRSAFYKYKDMVFAYNEINKEKIVTLFFTLDDVTGILSDILSVLALYKMNVVTINQNIPINGVANITISLRTDEMDRDVGVLIKDLEKIKAIHKIEVLAME